MMDEGFTVTQNHTPGFAFTPDGPVGRVLVVVRTTWGPGQSRGSRGFREWTVTSEYNRRLAGWWDRPWPHHHVPLRVVTDNGLHLTGDAVLTDVTIQPDPTTGTEVGAVVFQGSGALGGLS